MNGDRNSLISARLDRLPASWTLWKMVALLSLGGFFEYYDMFLTGYILPTLNQTGLLSQSVNGLFSLTSTASFVAALFLGLTVGTMGIGFIADRFGRRAIFTYSTLGYAAANAVMAVQTSPVALVVWRFIVGVGIGIGIVTISAYIAELAPRRLRGRAFALGQTVQFCAVPAVAILSYLLVPLAPLGLAGWRWVALLGSSGAALVWWLRRGLPESPRWLASRGRTDEADQVVRAIETRVAAEHRAFLPMDSETVVDSSVSRFSELWRPPYRRSTIVLSIFHVFQVIGYYGFANWVPTILVQRGITITSSLAFTGLISLAAPVGPLLGLWIGDAIERKWLIVWTAFIVGVFGLLFGISSSSAMIILCGMFVTIGTNAWTFVFHAYQAELFPTRIRARAIGFVYSWSRISAIFNAFIISFVLLHFGAIGLFTFIAGCMVVVMVTIGVFGPRTKGLSLEQSSH